MENAKKNLVFHFGVGRQASSLKIGYVKQGEVERCVIKHNFFENSFLVSLFENEKDPLFSFC